MQPTNDLKAEIGHLLFPMVKLAQDQRVGRALPAPTSKGLQQQIPWYQYAQSQMKNYGGSYGAPVVAGGLSGVGAYGLGRAMGFGQGGAGLMAAIAAPAGGYLMNRFQQGHMNPLLQGNWSWDNVGKALWSGQNQAAAP